MLVRQVSSGGLVLLNVPRRVDGTQSTDAGLGRAALVGLAGALPQHPHAPPPVRMQMASGGVGAPPPPEAVPRDLTDRFAAVLSRVRQHLPDKLRAEFEAIFTPGAIAGAALVLAAWAGSHAVGIGFVADAAFLALGYAIMGWTIFQMAEDLFRSAKLTVGARSASDLDEAAKLIAKIIANVGVGAFVALLTRGIGKRTGGGRGAGRSSTPPERVPPASAPPSRRPAPPPPSPSSSARPESHPVPPARPPADKATGAGTAAAERDAAARTARAAEWARRLPPAKQQKLLFGERVPNPNASGGMSNEIIGGHSPRIMTSPDYAFEVIAHNPDGTTQVKFVRNLPDGNLSRIKKSTLAPESWADKKIIETTHAVADSPPVATRARDGATLHRQEVDGVQWEVVRDRSGVITSSYPTGGNPTIKF